jgi:hypothetical protein
MPAPEAPVRDVPTVGARLGPAVPGRQWVVLDTPGDNAQVRDHLGDMTSTDSDGNEIHGDATRTLCVTPCVTDLHMGTHTLLFASQNDPDRHDRIDVRLGDDPLVVRHLVEQKAPSQGGAALMDLLGGIALVTGGPLAGVGASSHERELEQAGLATLGAGAALIIGGIVVSYFKRGTHAPGATTQWTIPASGKRTSSAAPVSGPPALLRF